MIVKVNDINLYYEDMGEGPAIVFIHGLGEESASWKYQMEYFKKSFRVISMDLRGHGNSEDGNEFITMDLFAEDIISLLNELKIEKAHFVGLSMGGLICQELTRKYQHRMLSMTLSDAAGFYPEEMATTGLETRLERIKTMPMKEVGTIIAKAASKPDIDEKELSWVIEMFQKNRPKPYAQATESTLKADYKNIHELISIPTLILVGKLDPVTPISFAQYLNEHIKDSKMQIIPAASHLSKIDNPTGFNKALLEFLAAYETKAYMNMLKQ